MAHARARAGRALWWICCDEFPKVVFCSKPGRSARLPGAPSLTTASAGPPRPGMPPVRWKAAHRSGSGRGVWCVPGQQAWQRLGAGSILLPICGFLMCGQLEIFPSSSFLSLLVSGGADCSLSSCKARARAVGLYFGFKRFIGFILMQVSKRTG